jgi:hypothetical protein
MLNSAASARTAEKCTIVGVANDRTARAGTGEPRCCVSVIVTNIRPVNAPAEPPTITKNVSHSATGNEPVDKIDLQPESPTIPGRTGPRRFAA